MKTKPSEIDGVKGQGMAKVSESPGSLKRCTGYLVVDDEFNAMSLMNKSGLKFSGPVYDDGDENHLTFPIVITHIQGGRVEFSATGDPYEKNS